MGVVKGGPSGAQPPSSSSRRRRSRLAAAICEHMAADLVRAGSASTTDMIFACSWLSASTRSPFMLIVGARTTPWAGRPLTMELRAREGGGECARRGAGLSGGG